MTASDQARIFQEIPAFASMSKPAQALLIGRFAGETIGEGYENTTEYTWETLCKRFSLPRKGNKEKEIELMSEEYFILWDIEEDVYVVEC